MQNSIWQVYTQFCLLIAAILSVHIFKMYSLFLSMTIDMML